MISIIVAYDLDRAIGANGVVPWIGHMKNDMRRLRDLTTGNAIIMGRKTFESIGRPLPHRQNIIISRTKHVIEGALVVSSLQEAYNAVENGRETFVFGGEQIYKLSLEDGNVNRIYATIIGHRVKDADSYFPSIDETKWKMVENEQFDKDEKNDYDYSFVTYDRVS